MVKNKKFQYKLWRIVNNCHSDAVRWSDLGDSLVFNFRKFKEEYLDPNDDFCKSSNIPSFVRQLNLYGFKKLNDLTRDIPLAKFEKEYCSPYFIRGRFDLLENVIRHPPPSAKQFFIKQEPVSDDECNGKKGKENKVMPRKKDEERYKDKFLPQNTDKRSFFCLPVQKNTPALTRAQKNVPFQDVSNCINTHENRGAIDRVNSRTRPYLDHQKNTTVLISKKKAHLLNIPEPCSATTQNSCSLHEINPGHLPSDQQPVVRDSQVQKSPESSEVIEFGAPHQRPLPPVFECARLSSLDKALPMTKTVYDMISADYDQSGDVFMRNDSRDLVPSQAFYGQSSYELTSCSGCFGLAIHNRFPVVKTEDAENNLDGFNLKF